MYIEFFITKEGALHRITPFCLNWYLFILKYV